MKRLLTSLEGIPEEIRGGAIAIGNFDGVHRGHRVLIEQLFQLAKQVGGPSIVFTFDPPPVAVLAPGKAPPALTWIERRTEILHRLGVDVVIACPTTMELLKLEPEEFFTQVLVERLDGHAFVEGPNFRFGHNRRGDMHLLDRMCRERGLIFSVVLAEACEGEMISSSRIRRLIHQGEIAHANQLLMEPYRLIGEVVQGAGRGRQLGFPTANMDVRRVLIPAMGVYCGIAWVSDCAYPAAIHIGPNPTFGEENLKVEVHVLDLKQDLYGLELQVELLDRIRGTQKFSSVEQLQLQLNSDIEVTRERVHEWMVETKK